MKEKLTTGFYRPTDSFKSIPEHIAVMFEDTQTLVAIVGAADDDPDNLTETNEYAELFAAAPETLQKLSHALAIIAAQATTIQRLTEFAGLVADKHNWIRRNDEIIWNQDEGNEFIPEHVIDIAQTLLAELVQVTK